MCNQCPNPNDHECLSCTERADAFYVLGTTAYPYCAYHVQVFMAKKELMAATAWLN